jgi:hypothetical protein
MLVAVVAVAIAGKTTNPPPDAAPVASPANLVAAAAQPSQTADVTPSPRSDWPAALADRGQPRSPAERVNKFTIDDIRAASPTFDTTPPWVRHLGRLANTPTQQMH